MKSSLQDYVNVVLGFLIWREDFSLMQTLKCSSTFIFADVVIEWLVSCIWYWVVFICCLYTATYSLIFLAYFTNIFSFNLDRKCILFLDSTASENINKNLFSCKTWIKYFDRVGEILSYLFGKKCSFFVNVGRCPNILDFRLGSDIPPRNLSIVLHISR